MAAADKLRMHAPSVAEQFSDVTKASFQVRVSAAVGRVLPPPDCITAAENSFGAWGSVLRSHVAAAPADCPNTNTRDASPPKDAMLS